MGIIDRLYDWWKGVECHYDENCTYENHGIYWIRKCWCSRRMPEKRVNPGNNKTIDRKKRWGGGSYWYEISWRDYPGPNQTNRVW